MQLTLEQITRYTTYFIYKCLHKNNNTTRLIVYRNMFPLYLNLNRNKVDEIVLQKPNSYIWRIQQVNWHDDETCSIQPDLSATIPIFGHLWCKSGGKKMRATNQRHYALSKSLQLKYNVCKTISLNIINVHWNFSMEVKTYNRKGLSPIMKTFYTIGYKLWTIPNGRDFSRDPKTLKIQVT